MHTLPRLLRQHGYELIKKKKMTLEEMLGIEPEGEDSQDQTGAASAQPEAEERPADGETSPARKKMRMTRQETTGRKSKSKDSQGQTGTPDKFEQNQIRARNIQERTLHGSRRQVISSEEREKERKRKREEKERKKE